MIYFILGVLFVLIIICVNSIFEQKKSLKVMADELFIQNEAIDELYELYDFMFSDNCNLCREEAMGKKSLTKKSK